jgi:hypothetical protein
MSIQLRESLYTTRYAVLLSAFATTTPVQMAAPVPEIMDIPRREY